MQTNIDATGSLLKESAARLGQFVSQRKRLEQVIELTTLVFYCVYSYTVLERWHLSIVWGWVSEILFWSLIFVFSYGYMRSGRWKGKVI